MSLPHSTTTTTTTTTNNNNNNNNNITTVTPVPIATRPYFHAMLRLLRRGRREPGGVLRWRVLRVLIALVSNRDVQDVILDAAGLLPHRVRGADDLVTSILRVGDLVGGRGRGRGRGR